MPGCPVLGVDGFCMKLHAVHGFHMFMFVYLKLNFLLGDVSKMGRERKYPNRELHTKLSHHL